MKVFLLCGGRGERLNGLDLPKPMCIVRGKSILYHVIDALPSDIKEITIVYTNYLNKYEFKRTVIHSCADLGRQLNFIEVTLATRGPVETAFVGLQGCDDNEKVLFIDNDTINTFTIGDIRPDNLNLGTAITADLTKPYSYVKVGLNGLATQIKEKISISNTYNTGLYFFPSVSCFRTLAKNLFNAEPDKREYFMSDLYALALESGQPVYSFPCSKSISLGTRVDITENITKVQKYPMRVCFDIDNTIITYSENIKSYDGIQPINTMIQLVKKLHSEGNTIVLHTARGMKSCKSNQGVMAKKVYMNVLECLEKLEVPYDEIYFGKPYADIYIDDKAWNQYTNPSFSEFFFDQKLENPVLYLPKNCSNNENTLYLMDGILVKEGPASSIEGEIFFYEQVPQLGLVDLFPDFHGSFDKGANKCLKIQYLKGSSVSQYFRNGLLTEIMVKRIAGCLEKLHTIGLTDNITKNDIHANYIVKLEERIKKHPNYRLPLIAEVFALLKTEIERYLDSADFRIAGCVHGDPWFDNMMFAGGEIKLLDMKGKLGDRFTLAGDRMTDWAKLYQSVLGFDFYLNGEEYGGLYENECRAMLEKVLPFPIDDPVFEAVTACCVLKTFSFFSKTDPITAIYRSLGKMKLFRFVGGV